MSYKPTPISKGEMKIADILYNAGISFEREKIFPDCYRGSYRFDFWLPTYQICLEIQGEQHYTPSKYFYSSKKEFLQAQERDRRKINYCLAKGYKIYCIPFWELESIFSFSDICQDKFLARSQFHNDIVWTAHQKS